LVKLFGEKRETLVEFLASIVFQGPMASAIKAETVQTIGPVALVVTPEGVVTCSMLDQITRENIYLHVEFKASIPGEIKEVTEIAFQDASLVKDIISNYNEGDTIFLSLNDDGDSVEFSDAEGRIVVNETTIEPQSIPGNDKGVVAKINWNSASPDIAGKQFNVRFAIDLSSLKQVEKMNKTLDTPHMSMKFSGKELYVMSGDANKKRTNLYKASINGLAVLDKKGNFVDGVVNAENLYPIGIVPLIKCLDKADGFARVVDDSRLEQLLFAGERKGIKKVYMIGAAAKAD
jgi:hypothetical protein